MPKLINNDLEQLAQKCADPATWQPALLRHLDEDCEHLVMERAAEIARQNSAEAFSEADELENAAGRKCRSLSSEPNRNESLGRFEQHLSTLQY
jgi:hypothetical protein